MMGAVLEMASAVAVEQGTAPVTGAIVIGVDYAPAAKVTMLLFGADGAPRLVAKLARRADGERALEDEHDALASLWSDTSRTVTAELPRPLALRRVAGRQALFATVVNGTAMTAGYYTPGHVRRPGLVARDFALAGAWLDRFQRETRGGTAALGPAAFGEWIGPTAHRYRAEVGWDEWESRLFTDRLPRLCDKLSGVRVPVVAVHGDYAAGNILLGDGRVCGVVDWELGRPAGLPFSDVFKFAASYGSYLDRASPAAGGVPAGHPGWAWARERWGAFPGWPNGTGVMYAFFGSGWFPDIVREYLRNHLGCLAIPPAAAGDTVRLFLPVFLAEQALALEHPVYRGGYRALLRRVGEEVT
jgi:phosphotransferase family enzyme